MHVKYFTVELRGPFQQTLLLLPSGAALGVQGQAVQVFGALSLGKGSREELSGPDTLSCSVVSSACTSFARDAPCSHSLCL